MTCDGQLADRRFVKELWSLFSVPQKCHVGLDFCDFGLEIQKMNEIKITKLEIHIPKVEFRTI